MKNPLFCPECDSDKVKIDWESDQISLPGGNNFDYKKEIHTCENCGESGIFSRKTIKENHERYLVALQENNNRSLESITDSLSQLHKSMAFVERSLRLPQRTISRWKSKGISASGMALMRIINAFPWILNVAEKDFDERVSRAELIRQAFFVFREEAGYPDEIDTSSTTVNKQLRAAWVTEKGTFTISAAFEVDRGIIRGKIRNTTPWITLTGDSPHIMETNLEVLEGDVKI